MFQLRKLLLLLLIMQLQWMYNNEWCETLEPHPLQRFDRTLYQLKKIVLLCFPLGNQKISRYYIQSSYKRLVALGYHFLKQMHSFFLWSVLLFLDARRKLPRRTRHKRPANLPILPYMHIPSPIMGLRQQRPIDATHTLCVDHLRPCQPMARSTS
jgi:hypothetical protein